jgi:hypothetical protein
MSLVEYKNRSDMISETEAQTGIMFHSSKLGELPGGTFRA